MLQIQNWLKSEECSELKKLLLTDVASIQEESSRVLIQSLDEPNRLADAQKLAEEASQLIKFVSMVERIQKGEYEFQRAQIGVSEKTLWQ